MDILNFFLSSTLRAAMPILIAGLGLVFSARAGVVNIGAEGMMLVGAIMGFAGTYYTGSAWLGLLIGIGAGALMGLLFAVIVVSLRADQTVVGVAFGVLGSGISITLNRFFFGISGSQPSVEGFPLVPLWGLSKIPIIGPALFNNNLLVYITIAIVVASHIFLFKTELGLRIQAVGEHPRACDTLGINVYLIRYGTIVFSGVMCGFAGAYMPLAQLDSFIEGMVAGRGYMALAAVVFGKWKPIGVLVAVLVFGFGETLQYWLQAQNVGIPYQFLKMIPYVVTILAVSGLVGKVQGPAASGKAYSKE